MWLLSGLRETNPSDPIIRLTSKSRRRKFAKSATRRESLMGIQRTDIPFKYADYKTLAATTDERHELR